LCQNQTDGGSQLFICPLLRRGGGKSLTHIELATPRYKTNKKEGLKRHLSAEGAIPPNDEKGGSKRKGKRVICKSKEGPSRKGKSRTAHEREKAKTEFFGE